MQINVKSKLGSANSAEEVFSLLISSRKLKSSIEIADFLHPPKPTPKSLLKSTNISEKNLAQSKELLDLHLGSGHDICVFGDYDADGVTATAIMWQTLVAYGKIFGSHSRILPFIPDRHRHGYGLSEKAISEVLDGTAFKNTQFPDFHPNLYITVDTGIVANDSVLLLRNSGADIILTDHHVPTDHLPQANCIIHSLATSGAGVAWIYSLYLLGDSAYKLLDLATIGIVGDMMPLLGVNRSLVAHGLHALSESTRPGIKELKAAMGFAKQNISTYDISFGFAPRINAAGRIYNPLDALRLLCTADSNLAKELAGKIESHNKDRQEYTDRALAGAAKSKIDHSIIILLGDYHEGVIGLVAGKLMEQFHRPAVVMSDNGDVIKGSARSLPGINITNMLRSLKTPFLGLGGHEQAAGFSLEKSNVSHFTKELEVLADTTISSDMLIVQESVDLELPLSLTTLTLARLLHSLEPFGIGNPKPKFVTHNIDVIEDRALGSEGKHHKLTVVQNGITREVLIFNTKSSHPLTNLNTLIYTLDINVWREKESLQLISSYVEV